jgi:hypothetical protein
MSASMNNSSPRDINVTNKMNVLEVFSKQPQAADGNVTSQKLAPKEQAAAEQAKKPLISQELKATALIVGGNIAIGVGFAGSLAFLPLTVTGGVLGAMASAAAGKLGLMKGKEDNLIIAGVIIGSLGTAGIAVAGSWMKDQGEVIRNASKAHNGISTEKKDVTHKPQEREEHLTDKPQEAKVHGDTQKAAVEPALNKADPHVYRDYVPSETQLKRNEELKKPEQMDKKVADKIVTLKEKIFNLEEDFGYANRGFEFAKARHDDAVETKTFNSDQIKEIEGSRTDSLFKDKLGEYQKTPDNLKGQFIADLFRDSKMNNIRTDLDKIHKLETENKKLSNDLEKTTKFGDSQYQNPSLKDKLIAAGVNLHEVEAKLNQAKAELAVLSPPSEKSGIEYNKELGALNKKLALLNKNLDQISEDPSKNISKYEDQYMGAYMAQMKRENRDMREVTDEIVLEVNTNLQQQMIKEIIQLNFQKDVITNKRDTENVLKDINTIIKSNPESLNNAKLAIEGQLQQIDATLQQIANNKSLTEGFKTESKVPLNALKSNLNEMLKVLNAPKPLAQQTVNEQIVTSPQNEKPATQKTLTEKIATAEKRLARLEKENNPSKTSLIEGLKEYIQKNKISTVATTSPLFDESIERKIANVKEKVRELKSNPKEENDFAIEVLEGFIKDYEPTPVGVEKTLESPLEANKPELTLQELLSNDKSKLASLEKEPQSDANDLAIGSLKADIQHLEEQVKLQPTKEEMDDVFNFIDNLPDNNQIK